MNNPNTSSTTLANPMPVKFPTHYTLSGQDGSIEIPYLPMGECCTSIVRELERQMGGAPEPGMRSKMLSNWKHRGYITLFSNSLPGSGEELYRKTGLYLKR